MRILIPQGQNQCRLTQKQLYVNLSLNFNDPLRSINYL